MSPVEHNYTNKERHGLATVFVNKEKKFLEFSLHQMRLLRQNQLEEPIGSENLMGAILSGSIQPDNRYPLQIICAEWILTNTNQRAIKCAWRSTIFFALINLVVQAKLRAEAGENSTPRHNETIPKLAI